MEELKRLLKKYASLIVLMVIMVILMCSILLRACNNNGTSMDDGEADTDSQIETFCGYPSMTGSAPAAGYDLPIDASQREEAGEDCKEMMELISELYKNADKGCASNVVIADEAKDQMVEKLKGAGCPVTITGIYSNMENYKKLEDFLNAATAGSSSSIVIYEIHSDGGIG